MANKNLYYTLTPNAPKKSKGVLCVVIGYKGQSAGREPFRIEGITNPNYEFWDKKTKRFKDGTDTAKANNPVLEKICKICDRLLDNPEITTPKQFRAALEEGKEPVLTLGGFLNRVIDEMRYGTNNKRPSRNYQTYRNLLHKLEREGEIINVPIGKIANCHFIQFSNFILSLTDGEGKSNYVNLMKLFKQVHKKAFERELNDNTLRFKYTDHAPITDDENDTKLPSLTLEQYRQFYELDLSTIPQSGVNANFYKELYHDVCMFLYEVNTRPVDFIHAHSDNIVTANGKTFYRYTAEKKKNYTSRDKVIYSELSEKALQIIDKYKGMSSKGYIFPFSLNEYDWDYTNAESWNKWNNRKNSALEMVRVWLKKVQKVLQLDFNLTLYTFRRSALSHACMAEGANLMRIALQAGTSVEMLQKHYVSNIV